MIVEQPDLFGDQRVSNQRPGGLLAHSRSSDPQSSKDAAARVDTNKQKRAILDYLYLISLGGMSRVVTADVMRDRFRYSGSPLADVERGAWSSRLSAMEKDDGLLEAAGEVPGRYGRPVRAFKLSEAGRAAAEGLRGAA